MDSRLAFVMQTYGSGHDWVLNPAHKQGGLIMDLAVCNNCGAAVPLGINVESGCTCLACRPCSEAKHGEAVPTRAV